LKASGLLELACQSAQPSEAEFQRLPAPGRTKPFPDFIADCSAMKVVIFNKEFKYKRHAIAWFVASWSLPVAKRRLISHRASDIQPERLEWVWPGRIARGKAALLGGPPGLGKSQVTANIAATVSTGGHWPCNEGRAPQGDVVILSAEDGMADTIVPRLIAAGANTNCVHIVAAATKLDGTGRKTFFLRRMLISWRNCPGRSERSV
jgi:hypothetical protein